MWIQVDGGSYEAWRDAPKTAKLPTTSRNYTYNETVKVTGYSTTRVVHTGIEARYPVNVTVPAGTFEAAELRFEWYAGDDADATEVAWYWFAPAAGNYVKHITPQHDTWELTSYRWAAGE